jgi:flagellar M-ring protein FliF
VINAPFRVEAAPKPEDVPFWQRPAVQDLARQLAMPFALALIGLAVVFGMIRPALKAVVPPAPTRGTQLDAVVDDALPLPAAPALEAPRSNVRLDQARVLAKDNPAAVANIVRGWVSGEA